MAHTDGGSEKFCSWLSLRTLLPLQACFEIVYKGHTPTVTSSIPGPTMTSTVIATAIATAPTPTQTVNVPAVVEKFYQVGDAGACNTVNGEDFFGDQGYPSRDQ